jgi:hypothetical protein
MCDVDCAGNEEGKEPEANNGGKDEGDQFCAELLEYKLY